MSDNVDWPFSGRQVIGMKLPEYLQWAKGTDGNKKKLLLSSIQRGFVWKPKQIVELWDSLLRGMPIGSLMVSKLSKDQKALSLDSKDRETVLVDTEAMGLLDGQQRTLAMLLGWPDAQPSQHCLWIDLGENGQAGSPFELRITTKTQPFGFQRFSHGRLSKHDRKQARNTYDGDYPKYKTKRDYELFDLNEIEQPRPWKVDKSAAFFLRLRDAWDAFIKVGDKVKFVEHIKLFLQIPKVDKSKLASLYDAFDRLKLLEVPLVLVPEHISQPQNVNDNSFTQNDVPAPLILLFERIGRNGASLSPEDLLFSMIKQQWPEAHDLVEKIHRESKVGYLMSSTDYVMTAYRLGSAKIGIADNPRPTPNDFHRHLGSLLGKDSDASRPLHNYLKGGTLASAFNSLYDTMAYQGDGNDIGIPYLMFPHFSRGLIQILLRWIMLNPDEKTITESRRDIIAFALFWYLCVWKAEDDNKASKIAFELIKEGAFPAAELYKVLSDAQTENDIGMALPLISPERLADILDTTESPMLRSSAGMFIMDEAGKLIATVQERELYKRFCWWRKPLLLWLQRPYVHRKFSDDSSVEFAGITDEDTVPYDYDHLCPQNHWGADWRNILKNFSDAPEVMIRFRDGRGDVGNCIGNLHVLDSSLNRSFGEDALASKLNSGLESEQWRHQDSLLYHYPEHEKHWKTASPSPSPDVDVDVNQDRTWSEARLQAFQSAVYRRARGLYFQYYEACKSIMPK